MESITNPDDIRVSIDENSPRSLNLFNINSIFYNDFIEKIVTAFVKRGYKGIIVSFDRDLLDVFYKIESKADVSNIKIIDCVSILAGKGTPPIKGLIKIYSPYDLNDFMHKVITEAKENNGKKNFVMFLSINIANEFYEPNNIVTSIQVILDKIQEYDSDVIFTVDRRFVSMKDPVIDNYVARRCDKVQAV